MRILSVVLVGVLVSTAGYMYGVPGALFSLPVAMLISAATEWAIARKDPSQSVRRRGF